MVRSFIFLEFSILVFRYICNGPEKLASLLLGFIVSGLLANQCVFASAFEEAQAAAQSGRYEDVVTVLTDAIENSELQPAERVVAYSNRGIAYSLLKAYGKSEADLTRAVEINPNYKLALNHLGILAEHVHKDYVSARWWYERAAELGFPGSQVNLANLYRLGRGGAIDNDEAMILYMAAAQQGYTLAYVPIGIMHMSGLGVKRDYGKGIQWLQRGKSEGVIDANYYLAGAYERATGLPRDYEKALGLYHIAAMQGHGKAQNALGYLYRQGRGTKQDYVEAAKWYRLSADQGINKAQNRLAWLMATCPIQEVCNGQGAVELALKAVAQVNSSSNLDTLAAAYARVGQFDKAIETIRSIEVADDSSKYAGRVKLYQQGLPYQL
jgi:TPR repeat protein